MDRKAPGHDVPRWPATTTDVESTRPAPTATEIAHESVVAFERETAAVGQAVDRVRAARAANDVTRWTEARKRLDSSLRLAARSHEQARARAGDLGAELADRLAGGARHLADLDAMAHTLVEPPSGIATFEREGELEAMLAAPIEGSKAAGYQRREAALRAEFDQLDPAESRVLAQRLRRAASNDRIAALFNRMTAERRGRLLSYLDGARRREAQRGPQRLPAEVRGDLEAATGASLGHIQVHADDRGDEIARAHDARAVAIGSDIYLGEGELDPSSPDGRELIAHEVAHVVQAQRHAAPVHAAAKRDEASVEAAEVDADLFAARFRAHGGAMSWTPAVGVNSTAPMRAPKSARTLAIDPAPAPSSSPIRVPDTAHPAVKDSDGEQLIQTDKTTGRGKPAPVPYKTWKALATVAETVTLADDAGDTMALELTYRLEQRPAEIGEVPDIWIHTERRALLTLGSGEHAGATLIGQARIRLAPDETLDPRAAIARPSIGAGHSAQVYLAESEQFVNVFGPGGRTSLQADAAANDLLAYEDPLRTMMGLKRILKQQHIAGRGNAVVQLHQQVPRLLEAARSSTAILEQHIKAVKSHHDGDNRLPQIRWVLGDLANWLAANHLQGRGDTEEAQQLRTVHRNLLELLETAQAVEPPERDHLDDALGIPARFLERAGEGLKEVGAMAVDGVALGIAALGEATIGKSYDWDPISKYGTWVDQSGASSTDGLVAMANGFADQWSDALERAGNGDYSGVMDVGLDTALMIDGARTAVPKAIASGAKVIAKGSQLVERVRGLATKARGIAARGPAEVREIAVAMAEAVDAFVDKQRASGMQMAGAGGPKLPSGLTPDSLAAGFDAARSAFATKRAALAKDRGIATLKQRLGKTNAPDVAEWVTRVEAALGGDQDAFVKFLGDIGKRVTDPAPLMRALDSLLASMRPGAADLATLLSEVLRAQHADPVAVLREVEWLTTRQLSAEAQSMLIRRAAKKQIDLDWVRHTKLSDVELEILGQDSYTDWSGFEKLSDIPARRTPGRLAERLPEREVVAGVNSKIRGVAAELVGAETELPNGLKVRRRIPSDSANSSTDYELIAPDGSLAELEVKGHSPTSWKSLLDEHEQGLANPTLTSGKKASQVARLVSQVKAGHARGHKVYVAISDATPLDQRNRLLGLLTGVGMDREQLIFLSESEIKRVGKQLREHMGIPQPGGKPPAAAGGVE